MVTIDRIGSVRFFITCVVKRDIVELISKLNFGRIWICADVAYPMLKLPEYNEIV